MPENEKKGITVKVDAGLHAEVRQYIEAHGMTMAEFVSMALDNELHPKTQAKEMENMRTMAFQVPEEMFQRIKEYLQRHHMTQKQFVLGLIEAELDRDICSATKRCGRQAGNCSRRSRNCEADLYHVSGWSFNEKYRIDIASQRYTN